MKNLKDEPQDGILSLGSQTALKSFLLAIADGERDLELARIELCNIKEFNLDIAFKRIK